jgi:hypothetical protein
MTHFTKLTALAAAGALLAACGGDNGTGTTTPQAAVTLNLATRASSGVGALRTGSLVDPLTLTDTANNALVITSAQIVLRKIELKNSTSVCTGDADGSGDSGSGMEPEDHGGTSDSGSATSGGMDPAGHTVRMGALHDGDCGELKLGPVLVDLPLTAGATQVFSVEVPAGTYDRVEYKIHRPSSLDTAFVAAHPDFNGVSIKVTGTYNGVAFTYISGLEAEQENPLNPPLTVATTGPTDLTLLMDIDKWFRDGVGKLVDPTSANTGGANEALVRSNIGGSSECFEDENRDGHHD